MRVFWWQGGLHLQPATDSERSILNGLYESLQTADFGHEVHSSPIRLVEAGHQEPVIRIEELPNMVP